MCSTFKAFNLTETDTKQLITEDGFQIKGFKTIFQKRTSENEYLRIVALVREELWANTIVRNDLMSDNFPSIWVEINSKTQNPTIIAGFYREWTHNKENSIESQISRISEFASQIDRAAKSNLNIVIMGDANIDYNK